MQNTFIIEPVMTPQVHTVSAPVRFDITRHQHLESPHPLLCQYKWLSCWFAGALCKRCADGRGSTCFQQGGGEHLCRRSDYSEIMHRLFWYSCVWGGGRSPDALWFSFSFCFQERLCCDQQKKQSEYMDCPWGGLVVTVYDRCSFSPLCLNYADLCFCICVAF